MSHIKPKTKLPVKPQHTRPMPLVLHLLRAAFNIGGHLAPGLTSRKAYNLWFTPTRFKTPVTEKASLEAATVDHIDINGHRIATYQWGKSGPTVLLVHGWSGRGTQLGSFVTPLLNAGYRVLSFDAPAHGKSSGKQTNLYEVADVIVGLQDYYNSFDSVITHSFGGPCTAVALQRGLNVTRIVNISPPATTLGLVEKFINTLNIPKQVAKKLIQQIESAFGKNIWQEISMKNTVKDLQIPAMVFHDEQDEDVPWQEGHTVASSWQDAKFIKTTGLGHRRILRDTDVIHSTVEFIAQAA